MPFADASGNRPGRRGPGIRPPACLLCRVFHDEDLGCDVSFRGLLLRPGIAIKVAEKAFAIARSSFGQVVNEGFDLVSACIAQGRSSAVIGGIGLHQTGVEPMLADQEAESVTEPWLTVLMAIVSIRGRRVPLGLISARRMR